MRKLSQISAFRMFFLPCKDSLHLGEEERVDAGTNREHNQRETDHY